MFACLLASGCPNDDVISLVPKGDDIERVHAVIEVTSADPLAPETVDFGEVAAGDVAVRVVTVRNIGTDTLQVQDLELGSPAFAIVDRDGLPTLLVPEASAEVSLSYSPLRNETLVSQLWVASNDRENPRVSVLLIADGLAPAIRIEPESFDFGTPEIGCATTLEIEVSNIGRATLRIDDLSFVEFSDSGELVAELPSGPVEMAPGAAPIRIPVHYVPSDTSPDRGSLRVTSNDPSRPSATSDQFGVARRGDFQTDGFAQDGDNSTDILFVVDDSGSMGEEQTSLATNFSSFVQIVDALDVDYHLGVTTTDTSTCSNLQGSTPIVTPSTPDPTGTFASNVNLGTGGSGSEQGLLCGELALTNSANDAFRREIGGLRVIFVSDEDDQSPGGVANYVQYYQSLADRPDDVVLSAISGGLAGCSGAGGNASTGSRYVAGSVATAGISASICDSNWVATLSALAWLSQSLADTFELSRTPIEDTIEVRINGVNVYVGWTFNTALSAIVFDRSHIPEDGDDIEVEYAVLGQCTD